MVYCRVDPSTCAEVTVQHQEDDAVEAAAASSTDSLNTTTAQQQETPSWGANNSNHNMRRVIDKDGSIKLVPTGELVTSERGFRKGMLALRDMKMSWTLNDFIALDAQFTFQIKRQPEAVCQQVSLDVPSIQNFQGYLQKFQFQRKRVGYCYGKFVPAAAEDTDGDKKMADASSSSDTDTEKPKVPMKAMVEAIYEPPQEIDSDAPEGFALLDDPHEETVQHIAELLGLVKVVGWILGHEARPEKGFVFTAAAILMAAEMQLKAASGVEETPFVTIQVAPSPEDGHVTVEAFQMSQQCMAMVAEEALLLPVRMA
jgi:nuclear protein localization family protein 4